MKYDYLIVGAGLFGSTFAHQATLMKKRCLVIEKRQHVGGNIYTEEVKGIHIHKYGAHVFHTSYQDVWDYVTSLVTFNDFINTPLAKYKNKYYPLPFNMNTFKAIWGVNTAEEAKAILISQTSQYQNKHPDNLELQAKKMVGDDLFEILIRGYSEKQWGKKCSELPASIIKRIPIRFTYDNNYFNDTYQGIPVNGYTDLIKKMLDGVEVKLNIDYLKDKHYYDSLADKIIYTGMIDAYFNYCFGALEYRSLYFEQKSSKKSPFQQTAVVNYTEKEVLYTRIIEHQHFQKEVKPISIITYEYPKHWQVGDEAYYPINDAKNQELLKKYKHLSSKLSNVHFQGRLGSYRYMDMDDIIKEALDFSKKILLKGD
ncbi:MAG: UDP-galactopyranose mutase [Candidatus Izemoplasmataceae bacterium]